MPCSDCYVACVNFYFKLFFSFRGVRLESKNDGNYDYSLRGSKPHWHYDCEMYKSFAETFEQNSYHICHDLKSNVWLTLFQQDNKIYSEVLDWEHPVFRNLARIYADELHLPQMTLPAINFQSLWLKAISTLRTQELGSINSNY